MHWVSNPVSQSVAMDMAFPPISLQSWSVLWVPKGGIISEVEEARCQQQRSPHLPRVQDRTVTKDINHQKPETRLDEAALELGPNDLFMNTKVDLPRVTSLQCKQPSPTQKHITDLWFASFFICQEQTSFILFCIFKAFYINLYLQSFKF